jgi:hypothetical protein
LEQSGNSKNVVVTHHAPSKRSRPEKSKDNKIAAAYASNLEDFIDIHKPNQRLWHDM